MSVKILCCLLLLALIKNCSAIWCYRCTSATPGCGEEFDWRGVGYLGEQCPENGDICVKVIERRGHLQTITRECLSSLKGIRTDLPQDTYEGCKPAAKDPHLGNYVFNNIKELDVQRTFYNNITFCYCFLDHRCNSASVNSVSGSLLTMLFLGFWLLTKLVV